MQKGIFSSCIVSYLVECFEISEHSNNKATEKKIVSRRVKARERITIYMKITKRLGHLGLTEFELFPGSLLVDRRTVWCALSKLPAHSTVQIGNNCNCFPYEQHRVLFFSFHFLMTDHLSSSWLLCFGLQWGWLGNWDLFFCLPFIWEEASGFLWLLARLLR